MNPMNTLSAVHIHYVKGSQMAMCNIEMRFCDRNVKCDPIFLFQQADHQCSKSTSLDSLVYSENLS